MAVSWVADPSMLLDWGASDPTRGTVTEKSNAIARLVLLGAVIAFFLTRCTSAIVVGVGVLGMLAFLDRSGRFEGLVGGAHEALEPSNSLPGFAGAPAPPPSMLGGASFQGLQSTNDVERAGYTLTEPTPHAPTPPRSTAEVKLQTPTAANPLMNVLLTDYVEDPSRAPAAPAFAPAIEQAIAEQPCANLPPSVDDESGGVDSRLFRDLGDELDSEYMMRQFYATANTQIPNAQGAFAEWIGRPWPGASDTFGRQPAASTYAQPSWSAAQPSSSAAQPSSSAAQPSSSAAQPSSPAAQPSSPAAQPSSSR